MLRFFAVADIRYGNAGRGESHCSKGIGVFWVMACNVHGDCWEKFNSEEEKMEQVATDKRRIKTLGIELGELKDLADMMSCILTDSSMLGGPRKPVGFNTRSLPSVSHERNHRRGK